MKKRQEEVIKEVTEEVEEVVLILAEAEER